MTSGARLEVSDPLGRRVVEISKALFENGLYCRADDRGDPVIQLAPPLIANQQTFDEIEQILRATLTEAWTKL